MQLSSYQQNAHQRQDAHWEAMGVRGCGDVNHRIIEYDCKQNIKRFFKSSSFSFVYLLFVWDLFVLVVCCSCFYLFVFFY